MPIAEQQLPMSQENEIAVLGAIILHNECFDQAAARLTVDDFALDSHRRIFLRMCDLAERGVPIDFNTLTDELGKNREIEAVGGVVYLTSLTDGLPRVKNILSYVKILENVSLLRKLIHACTSTANAAYEAQDTARNIYSYHDEQLLKIIGRNAEGTGIHVKEFSDEVLTEINNLRSQGNVLPGYSYGIEELDEKTTGVRRKEFTVIGARPKQGKTALALQIIQANCEQGKSVGFFSVEMNKEAILERLWSSVGKINFGHIRQPNLLTDDEIVRLHNAKETVDTWQLQIDDSADITINEITARGRLMKKRYGVELVLVDYMQIVNARGDIRQRLIKISHALRTLAKNQNIAVVGLSQLARPADKNLNRRPEIWDLKESGTIEADANTILLIFRPVDGDNVETGEDEILITQRSGQRGMAKVVYNGPHMRFESRWLRGWNPE